MKTVGTQTLEENTSKEGFISDEKIDKLLLSSNESDRDIGRVFLLNKYPELRGNLYKLDLPHILGSNYYALDWRDISRITSLRRGVSNTILIKKELLDD